MTTMNTSILGRMLLPLTEGIREEVLQAVAGIHSDPDDEVRYHELADKNAEGTITPDERRELESFVSANTILSILRAEARASLASRAA